MKFSSNMLKVDWLLLLPVTYLLVTGLIVLQSLSDSGKDQVDMSRQLLATGIGLVFLVVLQRISLQSYRRIAPVVYIGALILLVAVLLVGASAQGAERWISLGSFQLQPSEIAKVAVFLIIARLLAIRKDAINRPLSFIVVAVYALVPVALVVAQPDLGTAITIGALWVSLLAISRLKTRVLLLLAGLLVVVSFASWPLLADYQQARVTSFFSSQEDLLGSNYNVLQSTIAVGSGGLFGSGLDAGSQSQYDFLPSAHTDFVFAVTAEKLGLIGALSVIVAFLLLVMRIVMIAWSSRSEFGRYIAFSIMTLILVQSVVNIGMNLGLLPVTGLPLPFMSFGGTHIIVELAMIGMLLAVSKQPA